MTIDEHSTSDTVEFLVSEAKRTGLTPMALHKLCGLDYSYCYRLLNGKGRRPSHDTVGLLADALGWDVKLIKRKIP